MSDDGGGSDEEVAAEPVGKLEEPPTAAAEPTAPFKHSLVARFVPAICTVMMWLYIVTRQHGKGDGASCGEDVACGSLWDDILPYYPMTIAMIAGSLIAGSTPLGGGVVAFPVAVLVIGFTPTEGRDFTVLIQSIGMNAAAYLLIAYKSELLDFTMIAIFILCGIPGVLVGLALNLKPFQIVLTFQILVLEFAIVFFYLKVLAPRSSPSAIPTESTTSASVTVTMAEGPWNVVFAYSTMCCAAFAGGFLTANVGSGSDILLFSYGLLGWNLIVPPSKRFSDTDLTAASVVVMGALSLVTAVLRALTGNISTNVLLCWGATAWLVCFGAPLGSLLLTPGLRAQLRIAFYFLAIAQFIGFAVLKIKANIGAWIAFVVITVVVILWLTLHAYRSAVKLTEREKMSMAVVRQRLFRA